MVTTIKYILTIGVLLLTGSLLGQTKGIKPVKAADDVAAGKTIAVVVGISDYQNEDIPDLRFAHRDAELFAEYLQSTAGGAVKNEDITLLTNSDATSGKFISGLYGLMEDSQEGDQVIIYFSGHGDVESTTISQPGFLLCWDAPSRIYMSGGTFGLAYFQEIISTIAAKTKSQVLVVTDACRAGKLAGSEIGGAQATASHLAKQYANEIKILSCQPNEYALESESWGGGRGVFSYYFLRGIKGLADQNEDNIVTLTEISRYLEDMVTPAVDPHSQIPMVVGNRQAKISSVDSEELQKVKAEDENVSIAVIESKSIELTQDDFADTTRYANYEAFQAALNENHLLYPEEESAWEIYHLIKDYEELHPHLGLMKRNLAAALQDDSQQAINKYISGDQEELKRRWNYDADYWRYPEQLDKASQLLGEDHFYYKPLRARYFYFKGLVTRLEGEKEQSDSLYNDALVLQDSCLSYQFDAVYALNEKGYIYYVMKNYPRSQEMYDLAKVYISNWPLLLSNMSMTYAFLSDNKRAWESANKAIELDSNYLLGYYNLGVIYERADSFGLSLDAYNKALEIDSTLGFIYHRVSQVYNKLKMPDDALYWNLKGLEYDSTDLELLLNTAHDYLGLDDHKNAKKYFFKLKTYHPDALESYQGIIEYYFYTGNLENARKELEKYVLEYPDDEFALYLIASIYAGEHKDIKAFEYLEEAFLKGFSEIKTLEEDENFNELILEKKYRDLMIKYGLK